eukprot:1386533-Pyramimonas_sp.AAC.3
MFAPVGGAPIRASQRELLTGPRGRLRGDLVALHPVCAHDLVYVQVLLCDIRAGDNPAFVEPHGIHLPIDGPMHCNSHQASSLG